MNWYYQKMGLHIKEFWFNTAKVSVPFILTTGVLMLVRLYIPINNLFSFSYLQWCTFLCTYSYL